jgi:hypothetical protein
MKNRRRTLAFDSLESVMLLSSFHPGVGHPSSGAHGTKLPAYVRSVVRAAHQVGSHVSVTTIAGAPGSATEYQIAFEAKGQTYTTDIWVQDHGPKVGPQPG